MMSARKSPDYTRKNGWSHCNMINFAAKLQQNNSIEQCLVCGMLFRVCLISTFLNREVNCGLVAEGLVAPTHSFWLSCATTQAQCAIPLAVNMNRVVHRSQWCTWITCLIWNKKKDWMIKIEKLHSRFFFWHFLGIYPCFFLYRLYAYGLVRNNRPL